MPKKVAANNRKKSIPPQQKSQWTLMFYIAGDSGLSASMISQLKELTDAGFQRDTNVLVYFDPNCNGRSARIFDVNHWRKKYADRKTIIGDGVDPYVRNIAEDCHIPGLPQIPSALTLRYFLEYSRSYYPAQNYMLFLMGHGVIVANDAFLPDEDDGSAITLKDLGWILNRFGAQVRAARDEFHLVGFHSCSMSSVELAYELSGSARYMMGTQGTAFPGSWPYRQLLKKIFCAIQRFKRSNQKGLVKEIIEGLQDLSFYNSEDFWLAGYSADLSMCSLDQSQVNQLTKPLRYLSGALKKGLENEATKNCIQLAHLESQSYWSENYTDLYDFCDCLSQKCKGRTGPQAAIRRACDQITKVLASKGRIKFDRLVLASDYYGPAYQFSNGLSIYFPWSKPSSTVMRIYEEYDFAKLEKTDSWHSFLEAYFDATRRDLRDGKFRNQKEVPSTPASGLVVASRGFDWLRMLPDEVLLALGPPPDKVGLGAIKPPDKVGLGWWGPPGKVGLGGEGPPGKVGLGGEGRPGKVGLGGEGPQGKVGLGGEGPQGKVGLGGEGPPGKVGLGGEGPPGKVGLGGEGPPGKVGLSDNGPPGKVGLGGEGPPGKVGLGGEGPPGKVGLNDNGPPGKVGVGFFGQTVIKNFSAPENVFITRPKGYVRRPSQKHS